MSIRLIFRFLGTIFVVGLIIIGIYSLGVQFNWYGELEGRGDSIQSPYPEKLLIENNAIETLLLKYALYCVVLKYCF